MKKLFILFLALGVFACNPNNRNNRNNGDDRYDNRDNRNDNRDNRNDNRYDNTKDNRNDNNSNRNDNYNNRNDNNYNRNDNNNGRWSVADEDKFTDECVRTATPNVGEARAKEYCSCMLGKIEKKYANYEEANTKMTNIEMKPLADECNGKNSTQGNQYGGNGNEPNQ